MQHQKGKRLNSYQHCLLRPDMYLGSVLTVLQDVWVTTKDPEVQNVYNTILKKIRFNPGLFNIVRETVSNAIDNVWRSKQLTPDNPVKKISIYVNTTTGRIGVKNDGYCIPVRQLDYDYEDPRTGKVTTDKFYPAEVFFGDFNSGTNYEDDSLRKTSGRNGVGAKLPVTFSTHFEVECANHEDKKVFNQIYHNNGKSRDLPKIETYSKKRGYTHISYIPDYKYFKYPTEQDAHIDENFVNVLRMYAHEVAVITACHVEFVVDDVVENIKIPTLEKFARLFYPSVADNKMVSFKTANGDECVLIESDPQEMDECETISHISYVNGVRTKDGGIHVNAWRDSLIGSFVKLFNQRKAKKDAPVTKATARQVYPYLSLFIRTEVDRPKFSSQAKDQLDEIFDEDGKPSHYKLFDAKSKIERAKWKEQIDNNLLKVMKWGFVSLLEDKLSAKVLSTIAKKEGSNIMIPLGKNGRHANWAGTAKKHLTRLAIVEGKSPKGLVERGFDCVEDGHSRFGVYAIKGKFINAVKNSKVKVLKNEEAKMIKSALNLKYDVDYSIDANFETLHYGGVDLVPDQDSDGLHIRALLIGFFSEFKGLLERGYVESISTAVAALVKNSGKNTEKKILFYSLQEFDKYLEINGIPKGHVPKYYKGLGSIKPQDAALYFNPPKRVRYTKDEDADNMLMLGIGPSSENCQQRKNYITCDVEESFVEQPERVVLPRSEKAFVYEGELPIGSFIKDQLVIYHKEALKRAIPCMWDGLKDGQRKILYTLLQPKASGNMDLEKATGLIKSKTNYHHGGTSIQSTIVGMAQRYVGSNNIPLLVDDGEVGCVDPDTGILMWDGTVKLAKDVAVGDVLTGDDGGKRIVSKTVSGTDVMYKIKQSEGDDYVVNHIHILTLSDTWGALVDIKVADYIALPESSKTKLYGVKFLNNYNFKYKECPISVEEIGIGPFCGWEIDGNKRFLLSDRTITHNTRIENGGDAAAGRYVHTQVEDITRVIFPPEDDPILTHNIEDGIPVEFKYYVPIICMPVINGFLGIGAGWSTTGPCYKPQDVLRLTYAMLDGVDIDTLPELIPWYLGYEGGIEMVNDTTWESTGILEKLTNGYWHIRELAIGVSTNDFKECLEYLQYGTIPPDKKWKKLETKVIKDVQNDSHVNTIDFKIKPIKDFKPDIDTKSGLGKYLKRRHSLKNMILIDGNNFPHKFNSPKKIMKAHYKKRLETYQLRKDYMLNKMEKDIVISDNKYKFLKYFCEGKLKIGNMPKGDIEKQLEELGFTKLAQEKKKKKKPKADVEENEVTETTGENTAQNTTQNASYDYLLNMKIIGLEQQKFSLMSQKRDTLIAERTKLENTSLVDMWRADLKRFEVALDYFLKYRTQVKAPTKSKKRAKDLEK